MLIYNNTKFDFVNLFLFVVITPGVLLYNDLMTCAMDSWYSFN